MSKKTIGTSIKIKKYEDIFGDSIDGGNNEADGVIYVSPSVLKEFKNHPFRVVGKGIEELMESIRTQGVLSPIIVRPYRNYEGEYEIISGHRRRYCAVKLGIDNVPVIVRNIDDDEAVLFMVDSNIQREDVLPSEKAFAYKMRMEAIKRQGERSDLTSGQVVRKLTAADLIGSQTDESGRQIRRYIRLTELPSALMDAVDNKKIGFTTGVLLSFLDDDYKNKLVDVALNMRKFPSLEQAKKLREMSDRGEILEFEHLIELLIEKKDSKYNVNLDRMEIRRFFPKEYTAKQIEEAIIEILKERETGKP